VKVLVNLVTSDDYYSVREIKGLMIESYGEPYKWLTHEWIGRAMRRQDFKQKRRVKTGVEYFLSPATIKQVAELMDIEVPVSEGSVVGCEGVIQVFGYYTHKC